MRMSQVALTTDWIVLEPLEERHFDGLLASVREPSVWKYMGFADLSDARRIAMPLTRRPRKLACVSVRCAAVLGEL